MVYVTLYCTTLHYSTLYYSTLHYITLHKTDLSPQCTASLSIVLYYSVLYPYHLNNTVLYCTELYYNLLYWYILHCTVLYSIAMPYTCEMQTNYQVAGVSTLYSIVSLLSTEYSSVLSLPNIVIFSQLSTEYIDILSPLFWI